MKKKILAIFSVLVFIVLSSCEEGSVVPSLTSRVRLEQPTKTPEPMIIKTFVLPTATCRFTITDEPTNTPEVAVTKAKEISDKDIHLKLPSGLSIDAYALNVRPSVEPLRLSLASDYSQVELMAIHEEDRKLLFLDNRFMDGMSYNMMIQFGDHELKTRKIHTTYPTPKPGSLGTISIEVLLDDEVIYTANGGKGNTIFDHLRGLWSYNDHWVLEYVYVTVTVNEEGGTVDNVAGRVVRDGVLLNEEYSYEEVFGFQLMKGKPFYLYKENGQIGVTYDDQEFMLGFEEIPRYLCCSPAELNPRQSQNMISFFAHKNETWYYVEIGVYE